MDLPAVKEVEEAGVSFLITDHTSLSNPEEQCLRRMSNVCHYNPTQVNPPFVFLQSDTLWH